MTASCLVIMYNENEDRNMRFKKYIISLCLGLLMALPTLAQNKVVQGTVVDELGEPVIGATVRVEGTKTATVHRRKLT